MARPAGSRRVGKHGFLTKKEAVKRLGKKRASRYFK